MDSTQFKEAGLELSQEELLLLTSVINVVQSSMSKTFGSPHTTTHFIKDSFINNNISDLQNHKDSIISLRENIKNKRVNINEQIKNELITTIQNINNKDINDTKKVLENSISKLGKVKALEDINRELTTYITATNEQIRDLNKTTVNIQ